MVTGYTLLMDNLSCHHFATVIFCGLAMTLFSEWAYSEELLVGKVCPVSHQSQSLGHLVVSVPWFHMGREGAAYQAMDDATGIGVEIHFFANQQGDVRHRNVSRCDRYRILQVRHTTARLFDGERVLQIDVPDQQLDPFFDSDPLEYGRGTHLTPVDDRDKPWKGRLLRASTVAIYDTPYVGDSFGVEGEHITVRFETCTVCERDKTYDSILSCAHWGYQRDFMGGFTGWTEPEALPMSCEVEPSTAFKDVLDGSNRIAYTYWINWR